MLVRDGVLVATVQRSFSNALVRFDIVKVFEIL